MRKAVYAGSFDPPTNGHLWMIEQGARLFDELVVAVGTNPDKAYTFPLEQRVEMVKHIVGGSQRVSIESFNHQFLVYYANNLGAEYILRGIRSERDYEYERGMRHINSDLGPHIVTVFLIPPREMMEVSSSLVKGLIGPKGWEAIVKQYVPEAVYRVLLRTFRDEEEEVGGRANP
ncbi:pantetheine-phosphate adenylyltransferase [candidate division KSB3 bacterium]|uniref:Phosphopantetheine adenylyltransferase n=1 Tax=candidate division KSB3 bacterium TaxID=2044937 RepID=A0A9D5Q4I5_9BACT|nr:pantetheine-phosphate adenylyltransferase [candidate division KSB3 bacterium]MBD3323595.1 pantetheine-phosphate adenylyltransferase [candidate division KSB3 bacterium]